MAWEKVPQANIDAFHAALPTGPGVEARKMFGCPAGFVNGNMFCGAHETNIIVRLDAAARTKAIASGCLLFEPMGRPMKEYVRLPADCVTDVACLQKWFAKALAYTEKLPPKAEKPRKTGTAKAKPSRKA